MHFVRPRAYEAIMPPYVPRHREAVAVSGAAELARRARGGLARDPRLARWWLLGVLIAIFPANLHMALHPDEVARKGVPVDRIPRWLLWARLPLQPLARALGLARDPGGDPLSNRAQASSPPT